MVPAPLVGLGQTGPVRIAVLTAMVSELAPVRKRLGLESTELGGVRVCTGEVAGHDVLATITEMGTAAARRRTNWLIDTWSPDHLIVAGVAGGVHRDLAVGDLVVPARVVLRGRGAVLEPVPLAGAVPSGTIVTSDELQYGESMHAYLADEGAHAVDMETGAIGEVCAQRGVPWSVFRSISDRVDQHAEEYDVFHLARPDGSPDLMASLRYVARRPHRIPYLVRLGRGSQKATAAAAAAVEHALHHHAWSSGTPRAAATPGSA